MPDAYENQTFELASNESVPDAAKRIGDAGWEITYFHADHSRGGRFTRWFEARRPRRRTRTPKWEYKEFSTNSDGESEEAATEGWEAAFAVYEYHRSVRWVFKRSVV